MLCLAPLSHPPPLLLLGLGTATRPSPVPARPLASFALDQPHLSRRPGCTSLSPSTTVWVPVGVWPRSLQLSERLFSAKVGTCHTSLEDDAQTPLSPTPPPFLHTPSKDTGLWEPGSQARGRGFCWTPPAPPPGLRRRPLSLVEVPLGKGNVVLAPGSCPRPRPPKGSVSASRLCGVESEEYTSPTPCARGKPAVPGHVGKRPFDLSAGGSGKAVAQGWAGERADKSKGHFPTCPGRELACLRPMGSARSL